MSEQRSGNYLVLHEAACRALAAAASVDECKSIRDHWIAIKAYARQSKNRELEQNAVTVRLRATRRLGELMSEQKDTVGLNQGAAGGGRKSGPRGQLIDPRDMRPTLASQGIDKALAHEARTLARLPDEQFEAQVGNARESVARVHRRIIREIEIVQEREARRAQTSKGGSVADLHALAASGFRAGVIAVDPPWPFVTFSERSAHAVFEHYETMTLDQIKALPIAKLVADDCAGFLWCTWPNMPIWHQVIEAWGFNYSGLAFDWIKLNANGEGLHWGNGYGTRANPEPCLLARRGSPLRLDGGVHSVIMAPVGEHSEKPDEAYRRMERLFPGPYLELFARRERPGWTTWGDELPPPAPLIEAAE